MNSCAKTAGAVLSTFEGLRDQIAAGLNIGIAGIPWWTTDTGGFIGDVRDSHFKELLVRWFEFSVFSPVLRMHGDRGPHDIPNLSDGDHGGGCFGTGQPNELWSYGKEVFDILCKYLKLRLSMKDYIKSLMKEASLSGAPIMRTMFFEFPDDEKCRQVEDQYMFGHKYLVAPVTYQGVTKRDVYLPDGKWKNIFTEEIFNGPLSVNADAPLDIIPVFEKLS